MGPIQRGYGPSKPKTTPEIPILDKFGTALAGAQFSNASYVDAISGFPVDVGQKTPTDITNIPLVHARRALLGYGYSDPALPLSRLHDAGARVLHLAQCVREAGLCTEYLENTTLPEDNNSGLMGSTWSGTGTRYVGDIKPIYDATVSSLPYTSPMFTLEDREQYDNHPLIPFRLAYFIKAFMDESYKGS